MQSLLNVSINTGDFREAGSRMVGEFSLSGGLGRIVPFFRVQKICFLLHKRNFTICFRFQIYGVFCRLAAGEKGLYMRKAATLKVLPLFILQKIRYRAGNDTGPVRITWQQRLRQLPVLRFPCCCFR